MKQTQNKAKNNNSTALSSLQNYVRFPKLKKPFNRIFIILVLFFINISGASYIPAEGNDKTENKNSKIEKIELTKEQTYVCSIRQKFYFKLVKEVENYLEKTAPKTGLTADYLVQKSLEYDTDIIFVLSQGLIESHFGTKGKAAETNSVWNVGTYDDGQILYRYENANESLVPYLKLINEKYLININERGDTIYKDLNHLLDDKGYINYKGKRFASAKGYENALRKTMIKINMTTKINFYQEIIKLSDEEIIAYFAPEGENEVKIRYASIIR